MHSLGEIVVYGSGGVMTVVDIRRESVLGEAKEYYVLRAIGAGETSLTFVPCDNEKLVGDMQPLVTKEEIDEIILSIKGEELGEWVDDSRVRGNLFKKILENGDRRELLRMIISIRDYMERRAEEGKRGYITDENFLRRAEHRLYSEFSVVLGIDQDEVWDHIKEKISK